MLRISNQVASARAKVTRNPAIPGETVEEYSARTARTSDLHTGPQPGEQVVLRRSGLHQRADQFEILPRPHRAQHLVRHHEEEALRVDLGGVREEGPVTDLE